MTSYKERLNPITRKYETSGSKPSFEDGEIQEKMKKTFGVDLVERLTARLPGTGPKTMPYGYTSEKELRERILEIIKRPPKKLSERQMKAVGVDLNLPDELKHLAPGMQMLQQSFDNSKKKQLTPEERDALGERWAQRRIDAVRKQARLMTDQQLADWRMARHLCPGDRARYLGPSRNEVTEAQLIVPREAGQLGIILSVTEGRDTRIITFHPMEAVAPLEAPGVDKQFVDLQVREHSQGWLMLERVPQ